MNIRTQLLTRSFIIAGILAVPWPLANAQDLFDTEIKQIGNAQVQTLVETYFDHARQPVVFWHDPDWRIDLVLPAQKDASFSVRIRPKSGKESVVVLPERARQIRTVLRAPNNKAIVYTDSDSEREGFVIIDLRTGTIIDDVVSTDTSISPNRRFLLYDNWLSNWDDSVPHEFRLYDVFRVPRENTCGYSFVDHQHEKLDDYLRGFQVYPPMPICSDDDDNLGIEFGTNFTWAPDSSKIVFADIKNGEMSLVLVKMPVGAHDLPKTSVYVLKGTQNVCTATTDASGEKHCNYHVIQSVEWDGDLVKAEFFRRFDTALDLSIPVSAFVPVDR